MLFYCSEHMQKRESNICELDTCSFLRFSLPTNTEPMIRSAVFALSGAAPDGDIRSLCAASGPGSLRGAWNRTVRGGPAAVPEAGLLSGAGRRMGCAVPTGLSPPEARPLPGYSSSVSV